MPASPARVSCYRNSGERARAEGADSIRCPPGETGIGEINFSYLRPFHINDEVKGSFARARLTGLVSSPSDVETQRFLPLRSEARIWVNIERPVRSEHQQSQVSLC